MIIFAVLAAVDSVVMVIFVITTLVRLAALERDTARLKQTASPDHPAVRAASGVPAVRGTVRYSRQVKDGLLDVDLTR